MNEQIVSLLTMCAAITTIISGLIGFFGQNKYKKIFKVLFNIFIIFSICVFVKEIICFLDKIFLIGAMVIILFIICLFLNNRINYEVEKKTIFCLTIICITIFITFTQKYIVNIYTPNYLLNINEFIDILSSMNKIIDIYNYIFNNQNIIYTFSYIFNIIIICLNIHLTNRLINYQNYFDYKIGNIICCSITLLILSCGAGIKIMQMAIAKF